MTGERCDNTAALRAALDAYSPARVAERTAIAGVAKATLPLVLLFTLAGAFGAVFYLAVLFQLGPGVGRVLGGVAFSLGLFLIVVSGAELFTGNNLIILARCDGLIGTAALLRNWAIAVVFPITAFVTLGFEHSVANMFFLPLGLLVGLPPDAAGTVGNLAMVTAGNLVGGSLFVGVVYRIIYRRSAA